MLKLSKKLAHDQDDLSDILDLIEDDYFEIEKFYI
jgi:hypothetical protein